MPAVHTEALAGRGKTCTWVSAVARASGDRVLSSVSRYSDEPVYCKSVSLLTHISGTTCSNSAKLSLHVVRSRVFVLL